jgi:hypothetical protein
MRLAPRSYFWICWKVMPKASATWVWLNPMTLRRILRRAPTYRSTGWAGSAAGLSFIRVIHSSSTVANASRIETS